MTHIPILGGDKHYKGKPRPYLEAKSLHVIDKGVIQLVDVMNSSSLIRTIGSCQGHGLLFIKVPPYVSFKSDEKFASALASYLQEDFFSGSSKLRYFWELSAYFDFESELTYVLSAPGISSGKWFYATRRGVDYDLQLLSFLVQEVLDHFKGENIKMKSEPN